MALVDANYKFTFIDVGQYGSYAGGGVFQRSEFSKAFLNRELDIPEPKVFRDSPELGLIPHCIVADEAFPLRIDLMRPYPRWNKNENLPEDKAVFNYHLSRARRIVENAFGILIQRWRILLSRMQLRQTTAISVVKACCVLHNYMREAAGYQDHSTLQVNEDGDVIVPPVEHIVNVAYRKGYHSAKDARNTRDLFKTYFNSKKGSVPWQLDCVRNN